MRAIVMLHSVDDSGSVLSVSPSELVGMMRAIRSAGHEILPLGELLASADENRVAFTFDDGAASVAAVAAPLLREEGARATVFLTTDHVGRQNDWASQPRQAPSLSLMSWDDVESLHREGWEIGAHTRTHPDLRALSGAGLEDEVAGSKQEIERRLARAPEAFAYPYGYVDEKVVAAVRRHYRWAVTTKMAALDGSYGDPCLLPRIDAFYLRAPAVHRRFARPGFRSYLALRAHLRKLRHGADDTR